ncbi:SLBB domain-containing protein [Sphingomonas sp. TDK1]|uniref:SLBB domain-containing protein n=1 Tax=Sphingomonas sp. TDK1 TaxID=453247 RepID=UPI0007D92905|nr:SLBB domain-containing protein [Sphingomonas sp. TDK1]OAN66850.1 polysaccharide transporter [Sphingomonas sp. TDK1]
MYRNRRLLIVSALTGALALPTTALAQIPTRLPAQNTGARPVAPAQQQPQPATDPAPVAAPLPNGAAPAGYKIGVDDVIEADVLGQADFKTRARVRSDGTVTLPYLGAVQVKGDTAVSLADKLAAQLRAGGYYAKPIVSVEIVSFVSNFVTVLGQVGSSGLQPVDRGYHVSEIIARAGGLRADAADFVVLTRADGTSVKLDYKKLAQGGPQDDPVVTAGDKLFVPEVERFYIYGQINAPGVYPIRADMTLRRALAQGGGLTPAGSSKRVKVTRDGQEIKLKMEDLIKPGDTIVIGERLF